MKPLPAVLLGGSLAVLAALGGFASYRMLQPALPPAAPQSAPAAQAEPLDLKLPDLAGGARALRDFTDPYLVVNFWATWCAPCKYEIPLFIELQARFHGQGIRFVGIAVDDAAPVRAFADELGMNYPVLVDSAQGMALSAALGNGIGALPYTVVLGPERQPLLSKLGEWPRAEAEPFLGSLAASR